MNKLIISLGLFLLLTSCEPSDRQGPPLLTECREMTPFSVQVTLLENENEVEKVYRSYLKSKNVRIDKTGTRAGFCILRSDDTRSCYLPKLRGQEDDERLFLWGHEFAHVICGDWHPPSKLL